MSGYCKWKSFNDCPSHSGSCKYAKPCNKNPGFINESYDKSDENKIKGSENESITNETDPINDENIS